MAASSSSLQDLSNPSPLSLVPSSSTTSRRLPPPCWSPEETVALIDAYREKWYSLRRGNLRATHWQEVADSVALRCPLASGFPQKTSVQCRHKMEKLRKRYRSEIQRAAAFPGGRNRYNSSWVHFNRMDSMEKGPTAVALPLNRAPIEDDEEEDEEEENDEEFQESFYPKNLKTRVSHGRNSYNSSIGNGNNETGYPFRYPGRVNLVSPAPVAMVSGYTTPSNPNNNTKFGDFKNYRDGHLGKSGMGKNVDNNEGLGKKKESDPAVEMVAAIKELGDGFVRMERMKMDMAREVEKMRMEMEVKRTQMILESQHRILESFTKAFSEGENKKVKRMPSPEA